MNFETRMVTLRVVMVLAMLTIVVDQVRENQEQGFYVLSQSPIHYQQYVDNTASVQSIAESEVSHPMLARIDAGASTQFQTFLIHEHATLKSWPIPRSAPPQSVGIVRLDPIFLSN